MVKLLSPDLACATRVAPTAASGTAAAAGLLVVAPSAVGLSVEVVAAVRPGSPADA